MCNDADGIKELAKTEPKKTAKNPAPARTDTKDTASKAADANKCTGSKDSSKKPAGTKPGKVRDGAGAWQRDLLRRLQEELWRSGAAAASTEAFCAAAGRCGAVPRFVMTEVEGGGKVRCQAELGGAVVGVGVHRNKKKAR